MQSALPLDICYGAGQESRIVAAVQQKQIKATNANLISKTTFANLLFWKIALKENRS